LIPYGALARLGAELYVGVELAVCEFAKYLPITGTNPSKRLCNAYLGIIVYQAH